MNKFFKKFFSILKSLSKKVLKYLSRLIIIIILILGISLALFTNSFIQTKLSKELIKLVNDNLNTDFFIEKLQINPLGSIEIYNIKALDEKKNTLFSIAKINATTSFYKLILNPKIISFKEIILEKPKIFICTYKGKSSTNLSEFINKFQISKNSSKNPLSLKGDIKINSGEIKIQNENLSSQKKMIFFTNSLSTSIRNFSFVKNQIEARFEKITAKGVYEKDFEIKNFAGSLILTAKSIQSENFKLQTSRSLLNGKVNFSFKSLKDLENFTSKVHIQGEIYKESQLGFEDLNVFIKNWDSKAKVKIQGSINGTIDNRFILSDLKIESAKTKIHTPGIILSEISNPKKFSIEQNEIFVNFSYEDSKKLLPSFIKSKIPEFLNHYGKFSFKGPLEINSNRINAKGKLEGEKVGKTNLNLELKNYMNYPIYKGFILSEKLNLSPFLKKKFLLTGEVNFQGKSFSRENLEINLKGEIQNIKTQNNSFEKIKLNGIITGHYFEGITSIEDPKLSAELDGKYIFSKHKVSIRSKAEIKNLDLKALKISSEKQNISLNNFYINLKGENINTLYGTISIENGIYNWEERQYILPKMFISSKLISKKNNQIEINAPNFLKANLSGKFIWKEIPDLAKNYFHLVLDEQVPILSSSPKISSIKFDLNIEQKFAQFFLKNLRHVSPIQIKGEVDQNKMILNANLEDLLLEDITIKKTHLKIDTQKTQHLIFSLSKAHAYGQKLEDFSLSAQKEKNLMAIETKGAIWLNESIKNFEFNFYKKNQLDKRIIGFRPSYFFINNHKWEINKEKNQQNNLIEFFLKNKTYHINSLELCSENQKISLDAKFKEKNLRSIKGKFDNVNLEKIIPFSKSLKLKGKINGLFSLESSRNILKPDIKFIIKNLNLNEKILGDFRGVSIFEEKTKSYKLEARLANKNKETLSVLGNIKNYENENAKLSLDIDLKNLPLDFLEPFLSDVLSEIRGEALGKIKISGSSNKPIYKGNIQLKKASLKVNYLNVFYELANDPFIKITPESMELNHFILKNPKYQSQANLKGKITHKGFLNWGIDLLVESEKLLVLDTSALNNRLFHGKIFQKGKTKILINQDQINIETKDSSILGDSTISIYPQENKEEIYDGFIKYIKTEKKFNLEDLLNKDLEIKRDFHLSIATQINPNSKICVYLDKSSKNFIEAKGQGNILLKISPNKELELSGKYTLEEGLFQYSYENLPALLDKKFNVKKDSTITWTGKATNPYLEINAYYKKFIPNLNAFLGELSTNQSGIHAELNIGLSGELSRPNLNLDINFPDENQTTEQYIKNKLENPNEKLNQFASILLLGKFFVNSPNSPNTDTPDNINNSSIIYDLLFSRLNNFLSSSNNFFKVNIGYIQENMIYPIGLRPQLTWEIHRRLSLESALEFNFGMLNRESNTRSNLEMLNLSLEVDISKKIDNSLKLLLLFIRPTTFGIENNFMETTSNNENNKAIFSSQTYGTGFIYNTKFHSFKELLKRIFKKYQVKKK